MITLSLAAMSSGGSVVAPATPGEPFVAAADAAVASAVGRGVAARVAVGRGVTRATDGRGVVRTGVGVGLGVGFGFWVGPGLFDGLACGGATCEALGSAAAKSATWADQGSPVSSTVAIDGAGTAAPAATRTMTARAAFDFGVRIGIGSDRVQPAATVATRP
jgi:hypothetical protein